MRRTLTLFFWSAEKILLLRGEKIFPPRSCKISSVLKFSPRKDVCLLLEPPIYIVAPTTNENPPTKGLVYYLFAVHYDDAAETFAYPLSAQVVAGAVILGICL